MPVYPNQHNDNLDHYSGFEVLNEKIIQSLPIGIIAFGKDLKIIKRWEVEPDTMRVTQNSEASKKTAQKLAELKPDMVIAAQGD